MGENDMQKKHTRREFLYYSALGGAGIMLAACAEPPRASVPQPAAKEAQPTAVLEEPEEEAKIEPTAAPEQEEQPAPDDAPSKYNESPMLAERVAAGELPPVDERVPEEPMIIYPEEEIGQYGGTIRVGSQYSGYYSADVMMAGGQVQRLLRIDRNLQDAAPNVLKGWDISDDLTTITCHMRKGLKWSDGVPVTVDDMVYWYEDMLLNPDITPVVGMWVRPGDEVMKLEIIDDYTFRLKFAVPSPLVPTVVMAHGFTIGDGFRPAHYLKEYHIKYNDKANELATAAGFDFWYQYHGQRENQDQNPDRPHCRAFVVTQELPDTVYFERNPYFFMVDPEGNQLPYVDRMVMDRVADVAMLDAKVVAGQYDFAGYETSALNYSLYQESAEQGGYRIELWKTGKGGEVVYHVNGTWPDEMMRNIFRDARFRRALSVAINRQEINDVIYYGLAIPRQFTVVPESQYFKQEYSDAWAQYDPDLANQLLDEIGLEWDEQHQLRLWPDGTPMIIHFDYCEIETPKTAVTELVREYWEAIGIRIVPKVMTRTLLTPKIYANEEPMSMWHGDETLDILFAIRPKFFAPIDGDESCWGVLWGRWHNTRGEEGEEPPDEIKDLYNWIDEYAITRSAEVAHKLLQSQADNVWTIGTVGNAPVPFIVNKKLRNVAKEGLTTWDNRWTYPYFPEHWFYKEDED